MDANSLDTYSIEFTDGLKFQFQAYVTVTLNSIDVGSALKFKATLTPNSAIQITVPSFSS